MTQDQRQTFLQARAASHIHAVTTNSMNFDDVSTVTNTTNFVPVPSQVAQVSQTNSQITTGSTNGSINAGVTNTPFGGRAAHRG
jgi:hypothetical protein